MELWSGDPSNFDKNDMGSWETIYCCQYYIMTNDKGFLKSDRDRWQRDRW